MHTFTIRDLRDRTGELVRDAEAGKLSVVTKHGQPIFVAVPFDDFLLREGVNVALAVKLFDEEALSLREAAKLAGMTLAEFMEECSAREIPVVRYSPEDLRQELADLDDVSRR
ncbi:MULTISPECIES: type II toxin-antitoxin system prevent-host-death family antitoxin [Methylocaldum]|jgi:prevent-host-death family protein|uniref:type II toxin-antitoxin system prevent-host-death family antitoxin n=1 Tax=unclassified Methylocaldum TaxID=2622260 RepID=UPI000989D988|nr:type II toxin-antitoxin system prevent-host-death family antitoxin [Methylocaldum sp. 14B]